MIRFRLLISTIGSIGLLPYQEFGQVQWCWKLMVNAGHPFEVLAPAAVLQMGPWKCHATTLLTSAILLCFFSLRN